MSRITLFVSLLMVYTPVWAIEAWRMRAREHFEIHNYRFGSQSVEYRGLTNTINIWREVPYRYSYGLALGPVIGSARTDKENSPLGEEIRLWVLGLEAKYFPWSDTAPIFVRGGVSHLILQTDTRIGDPTGAGLYLGIGYEIQTKWVSVAPEIAYRHAMLSDDVTGRIFTASIGFHFY